jgi:hypothetical protein
VEECDVTGIQVYTGTYQRFEPSMGVPVRSTVGAPRFSLGYTLTHSWRAAMPDRAWLSNKVNEADFRRMYRHRLHQLGVDRLMEEPLRIAEITGDNRIVALCFDDLRKPGMWCHRVFLAEWLEEHGVPVIELFPGAEHYQPPDDAEPVNVQGELF